MRKLNYTFGFIIYLLKHIYKKKTIILNNLWHSDANELFVTSLIIDEISQKGHFRIFEVRFC